MAVRVGSARIDERGQGYGGKAGDQTGKEVAIENYYVHSLGWYVVRAKKDSVREKIALDMEYACANKCIGYDMGDNQSLWKVAHPCDLPIWKGDPSIAQRVRSYLTLSFCPTRIRFLFLISFSLTSFATVVLYLLAIPERVSPFLTV